MGRLFALLALVAFAPVHFLIAALIWLGDRGPVFHLAHRAGRGGRPFVMFKYRSMRTGSAPLVDSGFKTVVEPGDARVTPAGRILRCGLDEIPQLINIVRGEMAWIGPRPDELWMLPYYGPAIRERLSATPGITGLAQICDSRRLETSLVYALEIWGVRRRSAALTLRVLAMTPLFILGRRSIGRKLLDRLLADSQLAGLEKECRNELQPARAIS
jgi:lipopolysaccharide/colanic/teichoic acid biosynthesis glycosyltransferase